MTDRIYDRLWRVLDIVGQCIKPHSPTHPGQLLGRSQWNQHVIFTIFFAKASLGLLSLSPCHRKESLFLAMCWLLLCIYTLPCWHKGECVGACRGGALPPASATYCQKQQAIHTMSRQTAMIYEVIFFTLVTLKCQKEDLHCEDPLMHTIQPLLQDRWS